MAQTARRGDKAVHSNRIHFSKRCLQHWKVQRAIYLLVREEESMISMEAVWQLHSLSILISQGSSGYLKARGITPQVQGLVRTALGTVHHHPLQQISRA